MTIEESVKKDPAKFQAVLEQKKPDVQAALKELSVRFDEIIGGAIRAYCESEHVEAEFEKIPEYKTMNKLITEKLDEVIAEHVREKRKDL